MANMLHRNICVNDGFGVSKVVTSTQDKKEDEERGKPPEKFKDVELQAWLDEDDSQTQKQLVEQSGVSQQAVSNRMGKIRKTSRWVARELSNRQLEKSKSTCDISLARYKRKSFLHRKLRRMKS